MMPLINIECRNGHRSEQYLHTWARYLTDVRLCGECGCIMHQVFSPGTTLTHFRENSPSVIHNLTVGNGPVRITSHKQHREAMKAAGVEQGQPNWMRGRPGYRPI
jgi:hypothetical protein